jgi:hypothetical protein
MVAAGSTPKTLELDLFKSSFYENARQKEFLKKDYEKGEDA